MTTKKMLAIAGEKINGKPDEGPQQNRRWDLPRLRDFKYTDELTSGPIKSNCYRNVCTAATQMTVAPFGQGDGRLGVLFHKYKYNE
jgi:hypothetical protein